MLKKLMMMSLAVFVLAACNDEADEGIEYASSNPEIVDGVYSGRNMHFYGTAKVTDSEGNVFTDPEAWFEFAGGGETLVIYMHQTRFAEKMPQLDMRIYRIPYTGGEGASLTFSAESFTPQAKFPNDTEDGGYSYQDMTDYTLTGVEGSVNDIVCRISFTCNVPKLGNYRMEYEGLLLVKK